MEATDRRSSRSGSRMSPLSSATPTLMTRSNSATSTKTDEENVRVIVRVRPLSKTEVEKGFYDIVEVDQNENSLRIQHPTPGCDQTKKTFRFDGVFSTESTQAELFNQVARPIIENVIQGYNGTIFAYGQTGTGKTFSMEGDRSVPELKGIIPNSFAQIFSHISKESEHSKFLVRVSYLEIYNEDVRDLLGKDAQKKLEVKERTGTGVYVKNLSSFVVRNEGDMEKILKIGNKNRVVGSTNMNVKSSRSHAIFSIHVECSTEIAGERTLRMGKLNLVDLAGSERVSKTGASGDRLKEGAKINLSLSCLGNVIAALVEGQTHVPYRSSKLTRLLQDSLGGNSKTVMIANVGPAEYNYDETISTLRYADRAKHIKNRAHINEDPKDAMLRQFEKEIEELRLKLEQGDFAGSLQSSTDEKEPFDDEDGAEESCLLVPDEETLIGIKGEIENHERLSSAVQTEAESKKSTLNALKQNVLSWKQQQEKKSSLEEKLKSIQKKIMIGGENLLDKSQEQEAFLQKSMVELEERRQEQLKLQDSLTNKMVEKAEMEAGVLKLQESLREKKKELRKWSRILKKEQLEDQAAIDEEEAEKEALAAEIHRLRQRNRKTEFILDSYIPPDYLKLIKKRMTYNTESGSWDIPCIAYAGNHVDHVTSYAPPPSDHRKKINLEFLYKTLDDLTEDTKGNTNKDHRTSTTQSYITCTPQKTTLLLNPQERKKILDKYSASLRRNQPDFEEYQSESSEEDTPVIDLRKQSFE